MYDSPFNILLLGSGGREHALALKISQSQFCNKLFVAPGNAGTTQVAENVPIGVNDFEKIADFVLSQQIQMVVVGPEEPLVKGIKNYFSERIDLQTITVIGPDQKG
ncbi:MAG: phosphoribosylamine--glycine ligase, partial [Verrucomicrobia bacterium]|nr:phosphoribosylamine--glycine ligase [Cytophagales bacterium]